jgi:hypothetical protein
VSSPTFLGSSAFKVITITIFAVGALLMFVPLRLSRDPLLVERRNAERQRSDQALRVEALQVLRQRLNIEDERAFSTELSITDFSGLAEVDDLKREVPTEAKRRLLEKMKRMPGGTVGLAGTRGAGKTTLMRSVCAEPSTRDKPEPPLALVVDAPVRYDARDFILYLFARICAEVIGREKVRQMRGSDRPFGFPAATPWTYLADNRTLLGLGCLGGGAVLMILSLTDATDLLSSPLAWGLFYSLSGIWHS